MNREERKRIEIESEKLNQEVVIALGWKWFALLDMGEEGKASLGPPSWEIITKRYGKYNGEKKMPLTYWYASHDYYSDYNMSAKLREEIKARGLESEFSYNLKRILFGGTSSFSNKDIFALLDASPEQIARAFLMTVKGEKND